VPDCTGAHKALQALNESAVSQLKINAVPGYFLDGRRVAANSLYRMAQQFNGGSGPQLSADGFGAGGSWRVVVDWQR